MILKRLGAIALTVILIGGAWLIRDRVIEGNGSSDNDDQPQADREIVCVEDLREACDTLADQLDLDIRIEEAGATLDTLAVLEDPSEAPIWITMAPFPTMVDNLRDINRLDALDTAQTPIASSPIALVVPVDRAGVLATHCDVPQRWRCIGEAAGNSWETIGGDPLWREVRPGFSPIESAIGLLGVADAVSGYFGSNRIVVDDLNFTRWASDLADAVPTSARPPDSAIATIQRRSSALDIAVGAEAELSDTAADRFTPQYADPMIRADVVVVSPGGTPLPRGLSDDLALALQAHGWDAPSTEVNPLPTAPEMFAIREAWKGFL